MRAALLALALTLPLAPPAARAPSPSGEAGEAGGDECSAGCDRAAASCLDECEARFPTDAPARVGCKVKCVDKRVACSAACGK